MDKAVAAEEVVRALRGAGHEAYFAGGSVRDRVRGVVPKDFDIATSASPEAVQAVFPKTVPVGVQFGVITDSTLCPDPKQIIDKFEPEFAKLSLITLMLPWGRLT